ncbi:MAG: di-heme oxidoredictase family protein, partial [Rhizobiaceae bacterium]
YGDGEPYSLEKPIYRIENLGYGPLGDGVLLSARVAPQMIGLGLLEAVPDSILFANEDASDKNGDGVSGRLNLVENPLDIKGGIGRFGWKATQASLIAQNANAAHGDIGLTSPIHKEKNCTPSQTVCRAAPTGDELDLSQSFLDRLTLYTRLLAVPAQRNRDDPKVIDGEVLFAKFGCASCHLPTLSTDANAPLPELANQTFHPFTDLLLHDMGKELSDHRPEGGAIAAEWRTPPLWGIGLFEVTNGHQRLLHDGRARGVAEAILWHGGEAEKAREAFRNAPKAEREALIAFLNSL